MTLSSHLHDKQTVMTADNGQAIRVLVVEDDKLFRSMMADQLTTEGFIVSEAQDGKEATQILKSS